MNKIIAVSLCLGVIAVSADAKEKKKSNQSYFMKKYDADKDGKLSLEEYLAKAKKPERAEKKFKRYDKDGDGFISADEIPQKKKRKPKKQTNNEE